MPASRRPRCFLSHSSHDGEWVAHVAAQARATGMDVYLAEHDVKPGLSLSQKVAAAIDSCDFLVVLLTENSLASAFVQQEIGVAFRGNKLIIPILMGSATGADLGLLNDLEYIPLDPNQPQEGLARLSQSLSTLIVKQIALLQAQEPAQPPTVPRPAPEAGTRSQSQDIVVFAGVALLIVGLIYMAQALG